MDGLPPKFPSSLETPHFGEQNLEWVYGDDEMLDRVFADFNTESHNIYNDFSGIHADQSVNPVDRLFKAPTLDATRTKGGSITLPSHKETANAQMYWEKKPSIAPSNYSIASQSGQRGGLRWTKDEHKMFLAGLDKYGKGDWGNISRFCVVTKTRSQVACHAQKYFRRLKSNTPLEKRRYSIHDIRLVNSTIVEFSPRHADLTYEQNPSTSSVMHTC